MKGGGMSNKFINREYLDTRWHLDYAKRDYKDEPDSEHLKTKVEYLQEKLDFLYHAIKKGE